MSNVYRPARSGKTAQKFHGSYTADINAFVSAYLKGSIGDAKKLAYETSIGKMFVEAYTRYVIGKGLTPVASPENSIIGWSEDQLRNFASSAEAFWRGMTDRSIDWYGKRSFNELQPIVFKTILNNGDVLMHRTYSDRNRRFHPLVQFISGSYVGNPNFTDSRKMVGGVELDDRGREIAYYVMQPDESTRIDTVDYKRFAKYNGNFMEFDLVSLSASETNQVRGVPYLSTVLDDIVALESFKDAAVSKALVQSLFTVAIEHKEEPTASVIDDIKDLASASAQDMDQLPDSSEDSISLGHGNILSLYPNETMNMVESKVPGTSFAEFMNAILTTIGGALNVPREMAVSSYSSSFSASRGTTLSAEKGYEVIRQQFAEKICIPVWEMVIDYGIRIGAIEAPGYIDNPDIRKAILSTTWIGPSPVNFNPQQEVNASVTAIQNGLSTREMEARKLNGMDFSEIAQRLREENEMMGEISPSENEDETVVDEEEENEDEEE